MKNLTKAEEQVMQALWKLEKGFLKEIAEAMPDPKPHPNSSYTIEDLNREGVCKCYHIWTHERI
jgi:predicted transcriptional regulator